MRLIVRKSPPLRGTVRISGSKNSVLPVLAASLLAEGKSRIGDIPNLKDVVIMQDLLKHFGADIKWDKTKGIIDICADNITEYEALYDLASQMRASFLVMGPLLARIGKAKVPLPGGCAIGSRPVDLHLKGFAALGAEIIQQNGYVEAYAAKLKELRFI